MRKNLSRILSVVLIVALILSVPIASKVVNKSVKADDYQLVWSDEFDGTSLDRSNWTVETGTGSWGWGNNEQQYYRDSTDNIEVSDGTLKIHALKQSYGGKKYTSARMKTQGKRYFTYGRIEARMKLPRFDGAWPAFWMLGENNSTVGWPKCGEMDIMEAVNSNNYVYSTLHWSYNNEHKSTDGSAFNVGDRTAWHTYTMEWTYKKATFFVDGIESNSFDITSTAQMEELRANQFIILNLAVGGEWPGYNIDDDAFPDESTMEVDYVRVYQKPEEPTTKYDGPTTIITEDAVQTYTGEWNSFFGNESWIKTEGDFSQGSKPSQGYTINVTNVGTRGNDSMWSIQGNLEGLHYYAGATYTYQCTLLADKDKRVYVKVADGNEAELAGGIVDLRANVPVYYKLDVTIPEDFESTLSLKFGWGKMNGDSIEDHGSVNVQVKDVSFVTTTWIPDPSPTTAPGPTTTGVIPTTTVQPTTSQVPTTVVPTATETPVITTKAPATSTVKPTTTKKITVEKGKIKKVKRKKKSLKVTIKKINGVTGYHVMYSDYKSFEAFDEKYTTKTTIKIKKLDRKTKYYIKARGYKKVGDNYIFGAFSKRKKVKTK
ncbi:MAG: glycoside hydrolase family 16 protein [Eubacterium sp.]|nr:glycoside hydrolase family 16 protein [Eubacterium sp.]